jgi:hypothetical protein
MAGLWLGVSRAHACRLLASSVLLFFFFHALRVAPYVARGSSFVVGGDVCLVSGLPSSDVFNPPQNSVVDFAERSVGEGLAAFWGGMKTSRAW